MTARRLSRLLPRLLAVGLAGTLTLGGAQGAIDADAAAMPGAAPQPAATGSIRLLTTTDTVTAYAYEGFVNIDSQVWLAAYGQGYEFWAKRARYSDPVKLTKTIIRGTKRTTTTAPAAIVDGMSGFKDGLRVTISAPDGEVLTDETRAFCPGGWDRQRVEPTGRTEPVYPMWCGGNWFTTSSVFGVEQGWATRLDAYYALETTHKKLVMTTTISKPVAEFLGIPGSARSVTQDVEVVDECELWGCEEIAEYLEGEPVEGFSTLTATDPLTVAATSSVQAGGHEHSGHSDATGHREGKRQVNLFTLGTHDQHDGDHPALGGPGTTPSKQRPARDTLPDLVSLPAWNIVTEVDEEGTDRLAFAANEWNAGPAPMVVEGYRRGSAEVMDAYQFFYRDGKQVGSTKTGTMEYHDAPEHDHWHFLDFAVYELVKPDGRLVTTSGKQSWCLAPTDPVDLTIKGAVWRPDATGLQSTCGDRSALWLREVLPVGWGDTYGQFQTLAFDLTGVPNGTYQIKVTVNPNGALHETTRANNVSLRTVVLGGVPGARTVEVPPYQGVDTETWDDWQ
jgi:hypothetical protein